MRVNVEKARKRVTFLARCEGKKISDFPRRYMTAAYRYFKRGSITKRQAVALGVTGAVLYKPMGER